MESLDTIGKVFNILKERGRQIEYRAFKKLKTIIAKHNFITPQEK